MRGFDNPNPRDDDSVVGGQWVCHHVTIIFCSILLDFSGEAGLASVLRACRRQRVLTGFLRRHQEVLLRDAGVPAEPALPATTANHLGRRWRRAG